MILPISVPDDEKERKALRMCILQECQMCPGKTDEELCEQRWDAWDALTMAIAQAVENAKGE